MTSLPQAFETRMRSMLKDGYPQFRASLAAEPPVSVRLNQSKVSPHSSARSIPWCATGRYLEQRPLFTMDPHLHAGAYYVQEASSMFIEQALTGSVDISQPLRLLDLCAAPGGKSTHLLSLISPESLLVSNEAIRTRATVLSENIQKWGYANVMITNNDPSAFKSVPGFFDVILVDAPCSGEGLFRKEPAAIEEWSPDNVALCAARQRRIVQDVWPALKSGGLLIYCTCTYNKDENEENLKWLTTNHASEFVPLPFKHDGIEEVKSGTVITYRFFPHKVTGEGFCLAVVRKLDPEPAQRRSNERLYNSKKAVPTDWLKGDFTTIQSGELSLALPTRLSSDIQWLSSRLITLIRGTALGTDKHGKAVPDHAAALSIHLDHTRFPVADLTLEQAVQFLRKETLSIDSPAKGFCLVRFEGNALGWINVLDKRINNLYPAGWRIRMK